jgi:maleate isomerase
VNAKAMDYFRTQGFEVTLCARMTPARAFTEIPPTEVYEWARTNVPQQAETVFIGGNGLRAVGAIHALEKSLRRPVLTANQVALWDALRVLGITSKVIQYGSIFTDSGRIADRLPPGIANS